MLRFVILFIVFIGFLKASEEVVVDANDVDKSFVVENDLLLDANKTPKKTKEQILKEKKAAKFFTPEVLKPVDVNITEENITDTSDNATFNFQPQEIEFVQIENKPKDIKDKKIIQNKKQTVKKNMTTDIKNIKSKNFKESIPEKKVFIKTRINNRVSMIHEEPKKAKVIQLKPQPRYQGDYRYYYEKALKEYNNGMFEQALKNYKISIRLNNKFSWSYYNIGYIYKLKHQYKTAIKWFNKAIELDPSFEWSYYDRGESYMKLEQYQRAINDLSVTLELDKNNYQAHEDMAYCYKKLLKK